MAAHVHHKLLFFAKAAPALCEAKIWADVLAAHRYLYFEMHLPVISDQKFDEILFQVRTVYKFPPGHPINGHARGIEAYTEDQILLAMHLLDTVQAPEPSYG